MGLAALLQHISHGQKKIQGGLQTGHEHRRPALETVGYANGSEVASLAGSKGFQRRDDICASCKRHTCRANFPRQQLSGCASYVDNHGGLPETARQLGVVLQLEVGSSRAALAGALALMRSKGWGDQEKLPK